MRATLMYGAGDVRVEQARASGPHRPSTSRGGGGLPGLSTERLDVRLVEIMALGL